MKKHERIKDNQMVFATKNQSAIYYLTLLFLLQQIIYRKSVWKINTDFLQFVVQRVCGHLQKSFGSLEKGFASIQKGLAGLLANKHACIGFLVTCKGVCFDLQRACRVTYLQTNMVAKGFIVLLANKLTSKRFVLQTFAHLQTL